MKNNITPELVRAALACIPANLPRDEWARVGMAIKSEFADSTGLDLFTDWSGTADGFDLKATKSTWQSIKAGGGVGIGTRCTWPKKMVLSWLRLRKRLHL